MVSRSLAGALYSMIFNPKKVPLLDPLDNFVTRVTINLTPKINIYQRLIIIAV